MDRSSPAQLLDTPMGNQSLIQLPPNPISPGILTCTDEGDDDEGNGDLGANGVDDGKEGDGQAEGWWVDGGWQWWLEGR